MFSCLRAPKPSATSLLWLVVGLLLLPFGRHAAGAVLCIGQDGHMAIEGVAISDVERTARGQGFGLPGEGAAPAHCGPCTDLPLPAGGDVDCVSFKAESGPSAQVHLPLVSVLPAAALSKASPRVQRGLLEASTPEYPDFASLRSTVLLL